MQAWCSAQPCSSVFADMLPDMLKSRAAGSDDGSRDGGVGRA